MALCSYMKLGIWCNVLYHRDLCSFDRIGVDICAI